MTTPAWLQACAAEADKGFDPNIKSYHMGWVARDDEVNKLKAELAVMKTVLAGVKQDESKVAAERDALKAELFAAQQLAFTLGLELEALKCHPSRAAKSSPRSDA